MGGLFVREAPGLDGEAENPSSAAGKGKPVDEEDAPPSDSEAQAAGDGRSCCCVLVRRGWLWACIVTAAIIATCVPIGLRETKRLNDPASGTPSYRFAPVGSGAGASAAAALDPFSGAGLDRNASALTCHMIEPELPNATLPRGSPPPPLRFQGGRLVTAVNGTDAQLHGFNWFGFNTGQTIVDGLDGEKTASWEGGDFATIVQQLRLLGFNAVRLPFSWNDLFALQPRDVSKPCPPARPSAEALAARTLPPGTPKPAARAPVLDAGLSAPPGSKPGLCNAYLPNGPTTLARYLWVVQYFVANGFYVVVDYHPPPAGEPILDTVDSFVTSWLRLWMGIRCLPRWESDLRGRILLDLLNEPDSFGMGWDASPDDARRPLGDYYLAVMDALAAQERGSSASSNSSSASSALLFLIQGGGQAKLGTAWGDGFVTSQQLIKERGLADANPFFTALLARPALAGAVGLAPHLYGSSVTRSGDVGAAQWEKYAASWAGLQKDGYCAPAPRAGAGQRCQQFPVVIGELGSKFGPADQAAKGDVSYYKALVDFVRAAPPTQQYGAVPFDRWFYWAWNANSDDTGGLVGSDWQTLDWRKLKWLIANLGLKPWWKA